MAAQPTSYCLARPVGLPDSTPPRRYRAKMLGAQIKGRRSIAMHANMHPGGQVPAGTLYVTVLHQLPRRPVRPQLQHQSQRVLSVALVPRRGSLVVVYSGFIERLNRLKDAYVEYYSDAFVSVAKDPDIIFEESIDYRAEDDQMFDLAMKVSASSNEAFKQVLQIGAEVTELDESTQRADAAAWETLDKLQQQLAQHESALKILLDTRLIMQWKVLKHSALRLKNRMQTLQDRHGLALLEPVQGQAVTTSELRRRRAKANEMAAAELGRHVSGHIDIAADDALEQRFPVVDDTDLQALWRDDET